MTTNIKCINGVEINQANFPGDDGTGLNVTRRVRGFGIVTITANGVVFYDEDASHNNSAERCGKLGEDFKSEADLLTFIAENFE